MIYHPLPLILPIYLNSFSFYCSIMVKRNSEKKFSWKTLLFVLLIVALGISIALYATDVVRYSPEQLQGDPFPSTDSGSDVRSDGDSASDDDACDDRDADMDGYSICENDCDDNNATINPGKSEMCQDGIDNNCNQLVDCVDTAACEGYKVTEEGFSIPGSMFAPPTREVAMCCSGNKVDFRSDNNNCGFCGNVCSSGRTCTVFPSIPPGCAIDNCAAPSGECYLVEATARSVGESKKSDFLSKCLTKNISIKIDSVPINDNKGQYTGNSYYCLSFKISF